MKVIIKGDSMWPTFSDGDTISCSEYNDSAISLSAIVVFNHPLKKGVVCASAGNHAQGVVGLLIMFQNAMQGSMQMENLSQGKERYQTLNIELFSTTIASKER